MLFKAIGQTLDESGFADALPETERGRILVNAERQSSLEDVWAGGDCVYEGEDLTVFCGSGWQISGSFYPSILEQPKLRAHHGRFNFELYRYSIAQSFLAGVSAADRQGL